MSRFRFKAFEVEHLQSTMKVGTDAVLLASWVNTGNRSAALDIGTGCGVMALILANRSQKLQIMAIDTDGPSVEEATANFINSPWHDRLDARHVSLQQFATETTLCYDLIVSNPPWFSNSLRVPDNPRRNNARHDDALTYYELLLATKKLLTDNGTAAFIIPAADTTRFINMAETLNLNLQRMCSVKPSTDRLPNRTMLEFSTIGQQNPAVTTLTIWQNPGKYTDDYKELTNPFYLNF